jgi:hypothetical protein
MPFLNTVIENNLKQSIHNGILMIFTDYVLKHLRQEYGEVSIYNQEHYYPRNKKDEGFELPVYYHLRFIGIMYAFAIKNRIDISAISNRYKNMQSIYSRMVGYMIDNIFITENNIDEENPTNYHWLIGEIFSFQSNWFTSFNDENNFDENSSYISFIPISMSFCLSKLYRGLGNGRINIAFLNNMIYYHVLSHYFTNLNEIVKESVETEVLRRIPKQHLESILDYSLDKEFALNFDDFLNENFTGVNEAERTILLRLLSFLRDNNLL